LCFCAGDFVGAFEGFVGSTGDFVEVGEGFGIAGGYDDFFLAREVKEPKMRFSFARRRVVKVMKIQGVNFDMEVRGGGRLG
jgi:hypothetical protein